MAVTLLTSLLVANQQNVCHLLFNFKIHWSRDLSSKGRNASNRRHNNDSIELEVETTTWPLWAPHASESTGKEESYGTDWGY